MQNDGGDPTVKTEAIGACRPFSLLIFLRDLTKHQLRHALGHIRAGLGVAICQLCGDQLPGDLPLAQCVHGRSQEKQNAHLTASKQIFTRSVCHGIALFDLIPFTEQCQLIVIKIHRAVGGIVQLHTLAKPRSPREVLGHRDRGERGHIRKGHAKGVSRFVFLTEEIGQLIPIGKRRRRNDGCINRKAFLGENTVYGQHTHLALARFCFIAQCHVQHVALLIGHQQLQCQIAPTEHKGGRCVITTDQIHQFPPIKAWESAKTTGKARWERTLQAQNSSP